jgi:hypothetical protein
MAPLNLATELPNGVSSSRSFSTFVRPLQYPFKLLFGEEGQILPVQPINGYTLILKALFPDEGTLARGNLPYVGCVGCTATMSCGQLADPISFLHAHSPE